LAREKVGKANAVAATAALNARKQPLEARRQRRPKARRRQYKQLAGAVVVEEVEEVVVRAE